MELKISRVGNDGEGIAFYNKKPVYIYYAYKNEIVDIDLFTNKRGAFEGKLNKIIKPSPHRVVPKCPYYGIVGTSNLMHISYEEQLRYKKEVIHYHVNTKLSEFRKDIFIHGTIPSKDIFYYRNKIDVPVKFIGGKNKMGLYERASNKFIPIEEYILHRKELDFCVNKVLTLMDEFNINAYNSKTKEGYVSYLSLRSNEKEEIQLTFILRKRTDLTELVNKLTKENPKIVSIYYTYVPRLTSTRDLFSQDLIKIYGEGYLKMTLLDKTFLLTPDAFFQLNTNQASKLFKMIIEKGKFKKTDVVLDAYSGVGTIASFISPYVKEVVAIERVSRAIKSVEKANKINNITNLRGITGDVIHTVGQLKTTFDVMVFDPPREGLKPKVLDFILKQSPKKVIYVSCNPQTLVDDLKILSKSYKIDSITPFDMFPQTSHIESITILLKK